MTRLRAIAPLLVAAVLTAIAVVTVKSAGCDDPGRYELVRRWLRAGRGLHRARRHRRARACPGGSTAHRRPRPAPAKG